MSFRPAGQPRSLPSSSHAHPQSVVPPAPPFVVEGDEYDTAFFEKTPKFWHYKPQVAIVTSIEHDHVDIYPTLERYTDAFSQFVARVPPDGLVVANAADALVVQVVRAAARCHVAWYALQGDETHGQEPTWIAAATSVETSEQVFDVCHTGVSAGRFVLKSPGTHNVRNALAALAATCQGYALSYDTARTALQGFEGVRRRQDLIGSPRGVHVYDDFAHHPTAVDETLRALRSRHPTGSLIAVFEPRSATACRAMHQRAYSLAFGSADRVLIAPLGRSNIPQPEQLNPEQLASDLRDRGLNAMAATGVEEIIQTLVHVAQSGDVIALLSNGSFGGIHPRLLESLSR